MWYALSLLTLSEAASCPTYQCTSSKPTSGQCISYSSTSGVDTYKITTCEAGYVCPYTAGVSTTCQNYQPRTRYPGEFCQTSLDCMSNDCAESMCIGINVNSATTCKTTADCGPSLYCDSTSHCVSVFNIGAACTKDEQCQNDNVCDSGVCTQMFTLKNGENTTSVVGTFSFACQTGYSNPTTTAGVHECAAAPVSQSEMITACPTSGTCTAKDGTTTRSCQCAYNGNSYCPLFEGDTVVLEMIDSWRNLFGYSKLYCNGLNRWSYACFYGGNRYSDFLAWSIKKIQYFDGMWYKHVSAPSCVDDTILIDYKNLEIDYQKVYNDLYDCPSYTKLSKRPSNWQGDQCVYYSNNIYSDHPVETYQVASCSSGSCAGSVSSNATCVSSTPSKRLPGEYCSSSSDCWSNSCSSHRCKGLTVGSVCDDKTLYCAPGLYCSSVSLTCVTVSQTTCTLDSQCMSHSVCFNGECTIRFSIINGLEGAITHGSYYGYSEVCESGFAAYDENLKMVICTSPAMSFNKGYFKLCQPGTETQDSTGQYNASCQCSYDGNGYTPLFPGDESFLSLAISALTFLGEKTSCWNNFFTPLCVKHSSDYLTLYYSYFVSIFMITDGYKLANADDDIIEVFSNNFYTAYEYIDDSSSSSSFATALVTGLAFWTLA